jgi:hypothetical protein
MSPISKPKVGFAGTLALDQRGRSVCPPLADHFVHLGYTVVDDGPVDLLVNLNHNWKSIKEQLKHNSNPIQILIRLEPPSVYPAQYSHVLERAYDLVLSPGRPTQSSQEFIPWPYQFQSNPLRPDLESPSLPNVITQKVHENIFSYTHWKKRELACVLIAANKVSPNGSGNYDLRRSVASISYDKRLRIFGELWRASIYTKLRYRLGVARFALASKSSISLKSIFKDLLAKYSNVDGSIPDKHPVLENSKFSLVIENSSDYISEKLLDSLIDGCIPVYVGPDFEGTGLNEDLVIRFESIATDLVECLESLSSEFIIEKLTTIQSFIESEKFLEWDASAVYGQMATRIDREFQKGE